MKRILIILGIGCLILSCSQKINDKASIRALLVQQLKNTHSNQEWFVPTKTAIEGLTHEQSNWKDSTENHSIGELVSHLIFWNEVNLKAFKGEKLPEFNNDDKETFNKSNAGDWKIAYRRLDSIQTEWERLTERATDKQIKEWSSEIANMISHTAYHTGQIIYIRKKNGWWSKK
ncbi:DinB family protein [Arenibacter troitsensis]|uniref:DinB superfamily protein n=1 Tax=Arenibacter troitsensis TaxID=188872 RepID=A0A1X7IL01_9FLAO|nr:DinB family protein [Arenibacter troitsensis]SMG15019.1 DinB superfamily protein [Arenibacter troitsensis]